MYSKSIAKITAQLATPGRPAKVLSSIGLTACVVGLSACAEPPKTGAELAQSLLIIDTHIDVPYRLKLSYADVSRATDSGDFDSRWRHGVTVSRRVVTYPPRTGQPGVCLLPLLVAPD